MIAALKKLLIATMASWLFALWTLLCVLIGVALGVGASVAAIQANGIPVKQELARMAGVI